MLLKRQRPGASTASDARIARCLQPKDILLDVDARTCQDVLRVAAKTIGRLDGLAPERIHDALWRREQAGSTALGHGFAVPHARIPGIVAPVTAYLRTATPIEFGAADGVAVANFLVILVPVGGDHHEHLLLLAMVARLFSDRRFVRRLERAESACAARDAFVVGIERVLEA